MRAPGGHGHCVLERYFRRVEVPSQQMQERLNQVHLRVLLVHLWRGLDELLALLDVLIDHLPIHYPTFNDARIYRMVGIRENICAKLADCPLPRPILVGVHLCRDEFSSRK